jgi:hypothetical protein
MVDGGQYACLDVFYDLFDFVYDLAVFHISLPL